MTTEQRIATLRRFIETGRGLTNKPIPKKRLSIMRALLTRLENKERLGNNAEPEKERPTDDLREER